MSKIRTYESNSQRCESSFEILYVVPDVKDTNLWEQFTTITEIYEKGYKLFLMSKIRTYESNSQLHYRRTQIRGVVPDVKDTNLWEQFTTTRLNVVCRCSLFLMSKIRTYESNSQLCIFSARFGISCSWCQRYELMRAIHNVQGTRTVHRAVVPDVKDTNLWEQFTTTIQFYGIIGSCSWCQRYELMRAIHNHILQFPLKQQVVPDVKDTNLWEQFTTSLALCWNSLLLFLMSKIRTYESNSQRRVYSNPTN